MREKSKLNDCVEDKDNSLFALLSKVTYSPNTKCPWWPGFTIGTRRYWHNFMVPVNITSAIHIICTVQKLDIMARKLHTHLLLH